MEWFPALKDILEAIGRIERYVGKAALAEFMANTETQDAVVRNLEIIGEAVRHFPPDFRTAHPEVEWARIAGFRDRLIHQYFSVDWDILWDVVSDKLPALKIQVGRILDEMKPQAMDKLEWDEVLPAAHRAFKVSESRLDLAFAQAAWDRLAQAGLTAYQSPNQRLQVISRFLALARIYRDWCSPLSRHELPEEDLADWATMLGANPTLVADQLDEFRGDSYAEFEDNLRTLSEREHDDVVAILVEEDDRFGSIGNALKRSLRRLQEVTAIDEDSGAHQGVNHAIGEERVMWTLDAILDLLSQHHQRATYGAVGTVLGVPAAFVMQGRPRDARHSWVVNQKTHDPTFFVPGQCDPQLYARNAILMTDAALLGWLNNPVDLP